VLKKESDEEVERIIEAARWIGRTFYSHHDESIAELEEAVKAYDALRE
jgi:hypothetical protein